MALTQIHGNRQILDGTIKDADIAGDAAIVNSKLNLASIAQAVTLTHPNGPRVEAFDPQILLSDTALTLPDGLWRIKDTSGNLDFAVNRAAAGDFSANKIVLRLVNFAGGTGDRIDVFSLLQTTGDIRLQSAEPTVILRESDQALPAGLYRVRLAGDSVRFERNISGLGDFSALDLDVEIQSNNISVNKQLSVFANLVVSSAQAQIRLRETDQAFPNGLWRWILEGDQLELQRNTAAAGDFSTFISRMIADNVGNLAVNVESPTRAILLQGSSPKLQFVTQIADPGLVNGAGDVLYLHTTDRLRFRDSVGTVNTLAYTSELPTVDFGDVKTGIQITGLATPSAPTVTPQGTAGTTTWAYRITALGVDGTETVAGSAGTTTTGNAVLTGTNFNRLTWTAVPGAVAYNIYRETAGGTPSTTGKIGNTVQTTFDDTGLAAAGSVPSSDTTSALILKNTDAATGAKAWRLAAVSGVSSLLRLERDTSAAGDMSSPASVLDIMTSAIRPQIDLQIVGTRIVLDNNSHLLFGFGTAEGSMQAGGLYLDSTTVDGLFRGRLKFKSAQSGLVRNVTYHEDLKVRETPAGTVDGVNTVFTLSQLPVSGVEQVYLNGLLQDAGATEDYTVSGKTITFNTPPLAGDKIKVTYLFKSQ